MGRPKGLPKTGGRKKGTPNKKTAQRRIEEAKALEIMKKKIMERWVPLVEKQMELAEGVFVIKPIKVNGVVVDAKVYKEKPDRQSLEYLFSIVVGKPKENINLNVEENIRKIEVEIVEANNKKSLKENES